MLSGLALACASSPRATTAAEPAAAAGAAPAETTVVVAPLASLAAQHIALLPTHYFRAQDTLNLAGELARPTEYLKTFDNELRFALEERGVAPRWAMPEELVRSAKRNPAHSADPSALAAVTLRPGVRRRDASLTEPLASQLRSIAALAQARYVLFPVELRLENAPEGGGRAVVHLALVDARLAELRWAGEVSAPAASTPDVALAATLASRVADLIVAPADR